MKRSLLASIALLGLVAPLAGQTSTSQPAVSDLPVSVGGEAVLAADGPGKDCRGTPAVAFGAGKYLVAWREGWEGKNGGARIRAARVGPDARVIGAPLEVAPNRDKDAPQERPRVAFAKETFLVVWQDMRNGTDYDILAARVSADGKLLDAEPIKIAVGPNNQALPDVAADGEGFLVVWQGYQEKDRAFHGHAARVGTDGKVGETAEVGVAPMLRVAWDGTNFLVACAASAFWHVGDVVRVDATGKPLANEKPFNATRRVGDYCLRGVPGKGWLFVTHRNNPNAWGWGGPGAMRAYFVLSDGKMDASMPKENDYPGYDKLDVNWLDGSSQDRSRWPIGVSDAAWDGRQCVVVWQRFHCTGEKKSTLSNCDIMLMRTDGWKRQSDVAATVTAGEQEELAPALASDGAGRLLCVYEKETGPRTILCARAIESK